MWMAEVQTDYPVVTPPHPVRPKGRGQGLPSSSPGRGCPAPTIYGRGKAIQHIVYSRGDPCGRPRGGWEGFTIAMRCIMVEYLY